MKTKIIITLNRLRFEQVRFPIIGNYSFKIICSLLLIVCMYDLNAQTAPPPVDANVSMNNESATIYLEVSDTTIISEIEVILSSNQNTNDIFVNTFAFDQSTGLSDGMTYSRTGNTIYLGIGQIQSTPVIFSKIRLKNLSNNWSSWFEFVSN